MIRLLAEDVWLPGVVEKNQLKGIKPSKRNCISKEASSKQKATTTPPGEPTASEKAQLFRELGLGFGKIPIRPFQ